MRCVSVVLMLMGDCMLCDVYRCVRMGCRLWCVSVLVLVGVMGWVMIWVIWGLLVI